MSARTLQQSEPADVCLMLEGTYPYVLGGVSAWVDQIIKGLPELKFALFFIGSAKKDYKKQHYTLPPNVVSLTEMYLHERLDEAELTPTPGASPARRRVYDAMSAFFQTNTHDQRRDQFWNLVQALKAAGGQITFGNLLRDREAWRVLEHAYARFSPEESFIDFFWTARFLHLPLWQIWLAHERIPPAKLYHSVSAGYAGFAAALAAQLHNTPYILTEHGIYTKERIAEISQADWVYEPESNQINFEQGLGKLKQMWIGLFSFLGRVAYDAADQIVTLYEGNANTQIEFGADPKKISVIPNGIETSKFNDIYKIHVELWKSPPKVKTIGFIGRVVPIKDVKTLLRAARLVCERIPEALFLIAGPYAEDPMYFEECQKIVKLLGIEKNVDFMGMQKIMEVLPRMDVLVLTSISEGLPLVVLEGMAAGLPNVASDVGACRELIFGRTPEDKAIGRAGRLTKILSPAETAAALVSILEDPEMVRQMGDAGRRRAEEHYSMAKMIGSYRVLYRRTIEREFFHLRVPQLAAGHWRPSQPVAGSQPHR